MRLDIKLAPLDLAFKILPMQIDGFKSLQLSNLHADMLPDIAEKVLSPVTNGDGSEACAYLQDVERKRLVVPSRTRQVKTFVAKAPVSIPIR